MQDAFGSLMRGVGERLLQGELSIDNGVSVVIGIDDMLVSAFHLEGPDQVLLYTEVAPLPAEGREPLYAALLEGQTFFRDTAGATLSVNAEAGSVLLQMVLPLRLLDVEVMLRILENFVQVGRHWRAVCGRLAGQQQDSGAGAASGDEAVPPLPPGAMLRV